MELATITCTFTEDQLDLIREALSNLLSDSEWEGRSLSRTEKATVASLIDSLLPPEEVTT